VNASPAHAFDAAAGAVEVDHVTKRFGKFVAVDAVSFRVGQGEIFGLLGPNGAGKTTLIRMLTTLTPVTSGTARVNGFDVTRDPDGVRQSIGVIPQALTSDPELTAEENISIHAKLYGVPAARRPELLRELLEAVDLTRFAKELVRTFSLSARFPAACAAASKSRAASCIRRRFYSSTSRPPGSIPFRGPTSGR
jgi:ABC-2 type transport system ATP-binding protein